MERREKWIDATRGFAIYLVVLGHCIQYVTPRDYNFRDNILFQLIYGFHMALFMLLSGYLFWNTIDRYTLLKGIESKVKGILIPCASWGLVAYVCDIVIFDYNIISISEYLDYAAYSSWFLWAIIYCSIYGFITKFLFRNHIIGYIVVIIVNYLIPEFSHYQFSGVKRMLPFFILGMLVCRWQLMKKLDGKSKLIIMILCGVLYLVTLKLQMKELITGTLGSICIILLFNLVSGKIHLTILEELGKVSICIYLLTGILFWFVIKESFRISDSYRYLIQVSYVFGMSFVLTMLAWGVGRVLQKDRVLSRLFMGK